MREKNMINLIIFIFWGFVFYKLIKWIAYMDKKNGM